MCPQNQPKARCLFTSTPSCWNKQTQQ
jgi:hypothetical protein